MIGILYLCDRKACEKCSYPECRHTHDIKHAVNFNHVNPFDIELDPLYVENDVVHVYTPRGITKTNKLFEFLKWLKGD